MAEEEINQLKHELQELSQRHRIELRELEGKISKEKSLGKTYNDTLQEKKGEIDQLKAKMVRMTRQLDEEVSKKDQATVENQMLERRLAEMTADRELRVASRDAPSPQQQSSSMRKVQSEVQLRKGHKGEREEANKQPAAGLMSTKIMRVIDQWMRTRDLQQALLHGAAINDMAFSTLVQVLLECNSLGHLDLSANQLTMDSCSDICQIITSAPRLSYLSLAENMFSLRAIGFFMTAIMERQNNDKMTPLTVLDLELNEGILAANSMRVPDSLMNQVSGSPGLAPEHVKLVAHVLRCLWRFLHETGHPQVAGTSPEEVALHVMDPTTLKTMESALSKIVLVSTSDGEERSASGPDGGVPPAAVTADLALLCLLPKPEKKARPSAAAQPTEAQGDTGSLTLPPITDSRGPSPTNLSPVARAQPQRSKLDKMRDPLSDLKAAFEPQKEKQKTFNLKQIVTRNGQVYMNMLEKLLETTEIDAVDDQTGQTLLEYACNTNDIGLAKLCYRRGAKLSQRTSKEPQRPSSDSTPFNIATQSQRYHLMEFLHTYGVKVNSADAQGRTALHIAARKNDVDATCRLVEWGADVNILDHNRMTPLHHAAAEGKERVTMLLLNIAADMNARDRNEYTAVAHAEANNHFDLMDRLVELGGVGHGLQLKKNEKDSKAKPVLGALKVSAQMLKSTSLGRISKVPVPGMPDHVSKLNIKYL